MSFNNDKKKCELYENKTNSSQSTQSLSILRDDDENKINETEFSFEGRLKLLKRVFVLSQKTFKDLFTLKKFLITLIIIAVVPVIALVTEYQPPNYSSMSSYSAGMLMGSKMVSMIYFWSLGLAFCIFSATSGTKLIADEVQNGTMLMLVSKPISRTQIFFGKYIAAFAYESLINITSLVLSAWVIVLVNSGNIAHFMVMIPFIMTMFLYGLYLQFLMTSISLALSSIFKKGRTAAIILLLVVILIFLGFFMIRTMIPPNKYAELHLYYIDFGFHLAVTLVSLIQIFGPIPNSSIWQTALNAFCGVFVEAETDPIQNIDLGSLEFIEFVNPALSIIILVGISLILMAFALIRLKKKEISN